MATKRGSFPRLTPERPVAKPVFGLDWTRLPHYLGLNGQNVPNDNGCFVDRFPPSLRIIKSKPFFPKCGQHCRIISDYNKLSNFARDFSPILNKIYDVFRNNLKLLPNITTAYTVGIKFCLSFKRNIRYILQQPYLMTSTQKMKNAFIDVVINRTIRRQSSPIAEVAGPTPQQGVQPIPHYRPDTNIAGVQDGSHLLLQPGEALPGWTKPPVFQEAVHVQVGQQRTNYPTLGSPALAPLATCQPSPSLIIHFLHRGLQPPLDQGQNVAVAEAPGNRLHQFPVGNGVEVSGQIGVHHLVVALAETRVYLSEGLLGARLWTIPIGRRLQIRLKDRLNNLSERKRSSAGPKIGLVGIWWIGRDKRLQI